MTTKHQQMREGLIARKNELETHIDDLDALRGPAALLAARGDPQGGERLAALDNDIDADKKELSAVRAALRELNSREDKEATRNAVEEIHALHREATAAAQRVPGAFIAMQKAIKEFGKSYRALIAAEEAAHVSSVKLLRTRGQGRTLVDNTNVRQSTTHMLGELLWEEIGDAAIGTVQRGPTVETYGETTLYEAAKIISRLNEHAEAALSVYGTSLEPEGEFSRDAL